ncbi:universal stress protein [Yinghuangia seranimata]|uniref:universal stress protein n=1 Tax=Yinghuangia seranimata TaxID=408067 RepID=UPI00248C9A8A|nr:universal stress protein [Yinghuangia seranimata]MDI2124760.1 universal stress protein [Yinghuangia seranimata]
MPAEGVREPRGHVLVAVDGSQASDNAVDWAADEAVLRGSTLEVLHAWEWNFYEGGDWYDGDPDGEAAETVRTAAERARHRRPGLTVTTTVEPGVPEDVLAKASERAGLLVLGSRGRGGFAGLLLGSVSRAVAAAGRGPVLVVRSGIEGSGQPPYDADYFRIATRPVVVGVSDESCLPAVEAAFAEASGRKQSLRAVHAWSFPDLAAHGATPAGAGATAEAVRICRRNGEIVLAETLNAVRDRYKDVDVHEEVVNRRHAQAMVEASDGASLVVIATRHRTGFADRHLGPVTHALLHHAHAPVLLVPVA